jgi:hypothetical protein
MWLDWSVTSDVSNKVSAFIFEVWEVLEEGTLLVCLLNTWRWRRYTVSEPGETSTLPLIVTTQQQTWIFTGWYQGVHEVGQWMCRQSFLWFRLSSHTVLDCRLLFYKSPSVECSKLTLNCKELSPWSRFRLLELTASQTARNFSTYRWV